MEYKYHVFISYSSADKRWAEILAEALSAKGIKAFLDQNRLAPGAQWEPQLAYALKDSQHLVVLWSKEAEDSPWVRRELGHFEAIVDPILSGPVQANRRLIFLLMEGHNRAYASMQMITNLKEAGVYDPGSDDRGVSKLNPGLWHDVVEKLANVIRNDDPSIRIPLAILAMRKSDLDEIDPDEEVEGITLNALLDDLGIGSIEDLKEKNYGERRSEWRPFGSPLNIRQILEKLRDEINRSTKGKGPQFSWEQIRNEFWTSTEVAKQERDKLIANPSLVVIDPISLYFDNLVFKKFVELSSCFYSESTIVVVLTPFTLPQAIVNLRSLIQSKGTPFFDVFFDPPIPNEETYANCGVNISDDGEFKRLLRFSLGRYTRKQKPQSGPEYLRV